MSIKPDHQEQIVPKIIRTPEDVEALIEVMGYKTVSFLDVCGVKYATFQHWKRTGTIPNDSALVLFNFLRLFPNTMSSLRTIRTVVTTLGETSND